MIIKIKGYVTLKQYTEHLEPEGRLSVPDNATVADVLHRLAVPEDIKVITMINGRHCDLDHIIHSEDKLVFFPPLEGG